MSTLKKIQEHGQSIWLDLLDRKLMDSGTLNELITQDGLGGLTSNPAIFEKAISNSSDYDDDIAQLAKKESDNQHIFFELAIKDIKRAADIFKPVFDKTNGGDGFVSLEVSPLLARDTEGTIAQARELWEKVDRQNVMIKIPGTEEGLPAIRKCISEGININVTLLFGLSRYRAVAQTYLNGLEDRVASGFGINEVSSVASFFLSRIDVAFDPLLEEIGRDDLRGEVAIASAKKAYEIYNDVFKSDRFQKLKSQGAKRQRLLWASTSTKDPAFSDVKYVEALIGKNTINTLPMETLNAFRDHGNVSYSLNKEMAKANNVLDEVAKAGIDINEVTKRLENEGIEKFNKPFKKLLNSIDQQKNEIV